MRVVVPFTDLAPGVTDALDATGHPYEMVEMTNDESYYWLIHELWADGGSFALVEHDITVHPTVFDELDACPEVWCAFPHAYICGPSYYGMGCVRFRSELIQANPDLMVKVGEMSDHVHPPRHWCSLDKWIQGALHDRHSHPTVLGHTHTSPSHGCI